MAVTSINLGRVSFNLRAFNLLESMRANQTSLYRLQNNIATGLRFLQPSEDPIAAASAMKLDRGLAQLDEVATNLRSVNSTVADVEGSMQEALDLVRQAQTLALQTTGDSATPDERQSLGALADRLVDQLITIGNRRHENTYLFSGQKTDAPFELSHGGVLYRGDANRRETIVDTDLSEDSFTVPGMEFFAAVSSEVRGATDLAPTLSLDTRISDLGGAVGQGVRLGRILVTAGNEKKQIDLTGCATVGDVLDRLKADLPAGLTASLEGKRIAIARTRDATITDVAGGRAATDLGWNTETAPGLSLGADLNPRLSGLTRAADLRAGAGLDLSGGFTIRNGDQSATIGFNGVKTVEDLLNRINGADVGVWARIASDGRSFELLNRVSGTDLHVEENGGLAATALGLRSLHAGTMLASLNDGQGVQTVAGADFRITTANGTRIDVDLDGATRIQDVLDRLNTSGGGAITAGLVSRGNGIAITDQTAGGGTLKIEPLNDSPALRGLGLAVTATGNQLVGQDVNPVRVHSPFTALLELRQGLQSDDQLSLQSAGQRLDEVMKHMQEVQGQMASQAQVMAQRSDRVETETSATRVLLSDVRDVDLTDAAVRFQQLQTALQANLSTARQVMNLSLLDYLR